MNKNDWIETYTEQNQKAEFFGGACAGGCGLIVFTAIVLFLILAYTTCSNGC